MMNMHLQQLSFTRQWRGDEAESSASDDECSDVESRTDDSHCENTGIPSSVLGTFLDSRTINAHDNNDNATPLNAGDGVQERATAAHNLGNGVGNIEAPSDLDDDHPPTPWGSSKAKQRIIDECKDESSDIQLSIGPYTHSDFSQVNFKQILHKYAADKYKPSLFRENMKRILRHLLDKSGPFKAEEKKAEPWYTSTSKSSKAYALLFLLYMNPDSRKARVISDMSAEQIWRSHPEFQQYELEKFKTYNKNMKALTSKRKKSINDEEASYHRDMLKLPRNATTSRGLPFWNNHPASELLKNDEASGVAAGMTPKQLRMSRKEYQDFPLPVFRKHIYQERSKQLAAPFWQHKRNKNAMKKLEEAQEMMSEWHQVWMNQNMEGLVDNWGRWNMKDM